MGNNSSSHKLEVRSATGVNYEITTAEPGSSKEFLYDTCSHILTVLEECYELKREVPDGVRCDHVLDRLKKICGITIDPEKGL